jgi:hypothetical protein
MDTATGQFPIRVDGGLYTGAIRTYMPKDGSPRALSSSDRRRISPMGSTQIPLSARRMATTAAFFVTACATGFVPIWWLGANEDTGVLTLYPLALVAIAGPLLTAGYVLTGHDAFRYGHRVALFLLVVGNVTLLASGTWDFILFGGCWNCDWPFTISKWLLLSTPIVMFGPLLRRVAARAPGRADR